MSEYTSKYLSGKFIQRSAKFFDETSGLPCLNCTCAAFNSKGVLFVGTEKGLCSFDGKKFTTVDVDGCESRNITKLFKTISGNLFAVSENTIYAENKKHFDVVKEFDSDICAVTTYENTIFAATENMIYEISGGETKEYMRAELTAKALAFNGRYLYIASGNTLAVIKGKRRHWHNIIPIMSNLPETVINDIQFDGIGYMWLATDDGLMIYDTKSSFLSAKENEQLPSEKIYSITTDANGDRWLGSDCGVIYQNNGANKYLVAKRYAPDYDVKCVAVNDDASKAYAITSAGVSEITSEYMTLAKKAAIYQEYVEKYHNREDYILTREHVNNGDYSSGRVHISDNDGLWTQRYIAMEAYRYAVTKDKKALENARKSVKKMLYLMNCTGIKGFTARAIRREGEVGYGDGNHEWHLSTDGTCEWKGETSSDEMTGHFYGFTVFYKLCANAKEKKEISAALCTIMDHILENNFHLCDVDGLPTTWADWSPESLNDDDKWTWERCINSLEILAFLKACYCMSGNAKYQTVYENLIKNNHYGLNVPNYKVYDGHTCHIDDHLSFLATTIFLEWEDNVDIRRLILMGLERNYNYEKIERVPSWCFSHAVFTGRCSDIESGIQTLKELPLFMYNCELKNSKRKNLVFDTEQEFWGEPKQLLEPLPADERALCQDDGNHFNYDCGDRHSVESPVLFLLPYWFGRYYNLFTEEED